MVENVGIFEDPLILIKKLRPELLLPLNITIMVSILL
jgi:hypothetical protein